MLKSLFNKVAGLKACNFIKETPTQVFSCEIWEIFKNTYFAEDLQTTASEFTVFQYYLINFFQLKSMFG